MNWDFMRNTASARLLVEFGEEQGVSAERLLEGTHLLPSQLVDPHAELSAMHELRIVCNLQQALKPRASLGFQLGLRYNFSTYGLWGYGLISSSTLGDALALALRFFPLTYAFTNITYHEEDALGVLSFAEPDLEGGVRQFIVERDIAAAVVLMKELAGTDFLLSRVTLRTARRQVAHIAKIERQLFGVTPEFGASINSLAFDRAILQRGLPQANPITVSMCEQMCNQLIEQKTARLGAVQIIKDYLNANLDNTIPSLERMARMTNMSSRTLKRRFQEEGTSFRQLLAESRSALAVKLLKDRRLTLTDIAERLGFSELSSFSQTFKRWHGVAPRVFRSRMIAAEKTSVHFD